MALTPTASADVLVSGDDDLLAAWDEVDRFDLVAPPGYIDYGKRRVAITRRCGRIPRTRMQIPTVWVSIAGPNRFPPFNRPSALKSSTDETIPDVMGFLTQQLAARRTAEIAA